MAALSDWRLEPDLYEVVDLRQVRASALEALLDEEVQQWRSDLHWDYRASADLVRRFIEMQALTGFCLMSDGKPVGYTYYVAEERKGLIGDLFVSASHRSVNAENRLLSSVINALESFSYIQRVESQLMMLRAPLSRAIPRKDAVEIFPRLFMEGPLEGSRLLPPRDGEFSIIGWTERRQDECAALISAAYRDHVDSRINDQYRSASGARRFLSNIIQYPGCGSFLQPASFLLLDPETGRVAGLCLASLVAPEIGHITQICVSPSWQSKGAGYELLRRSMLALADRGCQQVSLTVTAANTNAVGLYERVGFVTRKHFAAYVWQFRS
jgi:ribosomal protein S18 acetylase RimI-like enzyme